MRVNSTVLLAELPVLMLLPHSVPEGKKKKKINPSLKADFVCFSSDFDIAVFNGITAPNPPVVAWGIPRRQGAGGESYCAVPSPSQQASFALPCVWAARVNLGSQGARAWFEDGHFSFGLPTGDGGGREYGS